MSIFTASLPATTETLWRSLHDVGLAAWFGGNLMGTTQRETTSEEHIADDDLAAAIPAVRTESWGGWTPVLVGAIGAHLVGGAGLLIGNRNRVRHQRGVALSTATKAGLTAAALGVTMLVARDGTQLELLRRERGDEAPKSDDELRIERRMKVTTPLLPTLTGAVIVLGAVEGEQQRPRQMARDLWGSAVHAVQDRVPGILAA